MAIGLGKLEYIGLNRLPSLLPTTKAFNTSYIDNYALPQSSLHDDIHQEFLTIDTVWSTVDKRHGMCNIPTKHKMRDCQLSKDLEAKKALSFAFEIKDANLKSYSSCQLQ
jgi:hypothetical protein